MALPDGVFRSRRSTTARALILIALSAACSNEKAMIRRDDRSKTSANTTATTATATVADHNAVDAASREDLCPQVASTIKATASWKTDASGTFLALELLKPGQPDAKYEKTTRPVYGGKLVSMSLVGDGLVARVLPDSGSQNVSVYLEVSCAAGGQSVLAYLSFVGVGKPVTVKLI